MVKTYWLAAAFGAGIALGLFLARGRVGETPTERAVASESRPTPAVPPARADSPPAPRAAPAPVDPAPARESPRSAGPPPASVSFVIENAETERMEYDNYSGYSLPVDAGPTFGPQIADSIREGRNNSLAQEHLQLEREMRDDSWSYPLEADLQYMLAADPVMSRFKIEHVECRATLCELRVSGKDRLRQASAVNQWLHDVQRLPWPGGLTVGTAVFSGTEGGSEGMLMLRKPPPRN